MKNLIRFSPPIYLFSQLLKLYYDTENLKSQIFKQIHQIFCRHEDMSPA